jgi:hypothetical protein
MSPFAGVGPESIIGTRRARHESRSDPNAVESILNLKKQRVRFLFDPELECSWVATESALQFAMRYFPSCRQFAAQRSRQMPMTVRLLRMATCPVLPCILLLRRLRPLGRHQGRRLRTGSLDSDAVDVPALLGGGRTGRLFA